MSRELPAQPNLEYLKKEAKQLLHDFQNGDPAAKELFSSISTGSPIGPKLSDAQHALAREYGFGNWSKLKEHVDSLSRTMSPPEQLSAAVCASDPQRTARVLERHPELKAQLNGPMVNYGEMQALLAAVQRSDRKTIDVLLGAGADINARSGGWAGGIGVLAECAPDVAEFLMERGAKLDAYSAARLGMLDELKAFVGPDPEVVNRLGARGQTPLHYASTVEVAQFLIEHGADIDARDLRHESTPAQHMLRVGQARHYRHDRQDIARYLVTLGCRTDILMAAALGDLALVRRLLEANPDCIRTRVSDEYFPKRDPRSSGTVYIYVIGRNRTAHQVARDFGHKEVYEYLMRVSPEDLRLAQAFELGDGATFRELLAKRPNLVANLTPEERKHLPTAAMNHHLDAVQPPLAAGWPVDEQGGEEQLTALQWASWHGNAEMVREVLRHNPDVEKKDWHEGISALGSALHGSMNGWHRDTGDYVTTVRLLMDAGARAPKVTENLEASEPVREFLEEREQESVRR